MTPPQQERSPTLPDGPAATVPSPVDDRSHSAQELRQNCLQVHSSTDLSGHDGSQSLAPHAVSPIDINQMYDHGEPPFPDTVSEPSEDQRAGQLEATDLVPLDEARQLSVDSSQATLAEGIQPTRQPSPPPSLATKSTIAVSGGPRAVPPKGEAETTKRPPVLQSLGIWACATIAGGTALTLAVLGFLIFLWAGEGPAGGEKATYVWRKIMLDDSWSAQTITICALVVRTVAAAQAAVCTSLVAALLLERRRLPLSKVVPVSITRGINDGPFNFARGVLSWSHRRLFLCVEMGLLLVVAMVTFGTQFTSTILLSGFDTTTLVQFPQILHQNVLLSAEAATQAHRINSFSQFPPSYALFGELESSDTPEPDPRGVSDTGVKLRAFVPFQEQQRTKLRAYTGPAFSERTQVMCMRPNMEAQVLWERVTTELGTMPTTSVSGTISYEETFKEAALHDDWELCSTFQRFDDTSQTVCLPQNFSCTLPLIDMVTEDPLPVIALCHLSAEIVGDTSQTSTVENMQKWNESSPLWSSSANSWVYLTLSTNLTVVAVDGEIGSRDNSSVSLDAPAAQAGEWQTYQVLPTMALNVSLCFAGLQTDLHNVSMSTAADPREPEVRWDPIRRDDGAEPGQVFMGTTGTRLSAAERGILSISALGSPAGLRPEDTGGSSHALWKGPSGFTGMFAGSGGGSWIMCSLCVLVGWAIPPDIAALFTRTVHTTGRASWAIQNFLTTYTESWYAQVLPQFDVAADVGVTFSTQVRIPRRWGGLAAALAMAVVNLGCVWAIAALYVVHTRYSRQGNVWHTVSQIMSEDTRLVLERSSRVMDEEVEKGLKADDYLVFIGKPEGSDKVSVRRP